MTGLVLADDSIQKAVERVPGMGLIRSVMMICGKQSLLVINQFIIFLCEFLGSVFRQTLPPRANVIYRLLLGLILIFESSSRVRCAFKQCHTFPCGTLYLLLYVLLFLLGLRLMLWKQPVILPFMCLIKYLILHWNLSLGIDLFLSAQYPLGCLVIPKT